MERGSQVSPESAAKSVESIVRTSPSHSWREGSSTSDWPRSTVSRATNGALDVSERVDLHDAVAPEDASGRRSDEGSLSRGAKLERSPSLLTDDVSHRSSRTSRDQRSAPRSGIRSDSEVAVDRMHMQVRSLEEHLVIAKTKLEICEEVKQLTEQQLKEVVSQKQRVEERLQRADDEVRQLREQNRTLKASVVSLEQLCAQQLKEMKTAAEKVGEDNRAEQLMDEIKRMEVDVAEWRAKEAEHERDRLQLSAALHNAVRLVDSDKVAIASSSMSEVSENPARNELQQLSQPRSRSASTSNSPTPRASHACDEPMNSPKRRRSASFASLQTMVTRITNAYSTMYSNFRSERQSLHMERRGLSPSRSPRRAVVEQDMVGDRVLTTDSTAQSYEKPRLPAGEMANCGDAVNRCDGDAVLGDGEGVSWELQQQHLLNEIAVLQTKLRDAEEKACRLQAELDKRAAALQEKADMLERMLSEGPLTPQSTRTDSHSRELPTPTSASIPSQAGNAQSKSDGPQESKKKDALISSEYQCVLKHDKRGTLPIPWTENQLQLLTAIFEHEISETCAPSIATLKNIHKLREGGELRLQFQLEHTPDVSSSSNQEKLMTNGAAKTQRFFNIIAELYQARQQLHELQDSQNAHDHVSGASPEALSPSDGSARRGRKGSRREDSSESGSTPSDATPESDGSDKKSPDSDAGGSSNGIGSQTPQSPQNVDDSVQRTRRRVGLDGGDNDTSGLGGASDSRSPLHEASSTAEWGEVHRTLSSLWADESTGYGGKHSSRAELSAIEKLRLLMKSARTDDEISDDEEEKEQLRDQLEDEIQRCRNLTRSNRALNKEKEKLEQQLMEALADTSDEEFGNAEDNDQTSPASDASGVLGRTTAYTDASFGATPASEDGDPAERLLRRRRLRKQQKRERNQFPIEVTALQGELEQCRMELAATKEELKVAQQQSTRIRNDLATLRSQVEKEVEQRQEVEYQLDEATIALGRYKSTASLETSKEWRKQSNSTSDNADETASNTDVENEIAQGALSRLQARYDEQRRALDDYRSAMRALREEMFAAKQSSHAMKRQVHLSQVSYMQEKRMSKQLRQRCAALERAAAQRRDIGSSARPQHGVLHSGQKDAWSSEKVIPPIPKSPSRQHIQTSPPLVNNSASVTQTDNEVRSLRSRVRELEQQLSANEAQWTAAVRELDEIQEVLKSEQTIFEDMCSACDSVFGKNESKRVDHAEKHTDLVASSQNDQVGNAARNTPGSGGSSDANSSENRLDSARSQLRIALKAHRHNVATLETLIPTVIAYNARHQHTLTAITTCSDAMLELNAILREMHTLQSPGLDVSSRNEDLLIRGGDASGGHTSASSGAGRQCDGNQPSGKHSGQCILDPSANSGAIGAARELEKEDSEDAKAPPIARALSYTESCSPNEKMPLSVAPEESAVVALTAEVRVALTHSRNLRDSFLYQQEKLQQQMARIDALANAQRATAEELEDALVKLETFSLNEDMVEDIHLLRGTRERAVNALVAANDKLIAVTHAAEDIFSDLPELWKRRSSAPQPFSDKENIPHASSTTQAKGKNGKMELHVDSSAAAAGVDAYVSGLVSVCHALVQTRSSILGGLFDSLTNEERRDVLVIKGSEYFDSMEAADNANDYSARDGNTENYVSSRARDYIDNNGNGADSVGSAPSPYTRQSAHGQAMLSVSSSPPPRLSVRHRVLDPNDDMVHQKNAQPSRAHPAPFDATPSQIPPSHAASVASRTSTAQQQTKNASLRNPSLTLDENEKRLVRDAIKAARHNRK